MKIEVGEREPMEALTMSEGGNEADLMRLRDACTWVMECIELRWNGSSSKSDGAAYVVLSVCLSRHS
eukprot:c48361_g1_i1 orf=51-251(+)